MIRKIQVTKTVMKIGKNYLIHVGNLYVIVGKLISIVCPGVLILEYASKVDIQAYYDRWHELVRGDDPELRQVARYWHFTGEVSIPYLWGIEWFGSLPVEFKRSESQ